MKDLQIIELFWQRKEEAIRESRKAYGSYCHTVTYHILLDREDAEECALAVQFEGDEAYYDYVNSYYRPATLAELMLCIFLFFFQKREKERILKPKNRGNFNLFFRVNGGKMKGRMGDVS